MGVMGEGLVGEGGGLKKLRSKSERYGGCGGY